MVEWPAFGGDLAATKFSTLTDINRGNVAQPDEGVGVGDGRDAEAPSSRTRPGNFQATPLMIGDTLFLSTSYNRVVALDANTGTRALGVRSQAVSRRPAAERHGLRASRRRDVDRRQAAADLHQQPLESHRARRRDRDSRFASSATPASSISRASSSETASRSTSFTTRRRRRRSYGATSSSSATASPTGSSIRTIRRATCRRSTSELGQARVELQSRCRATAATPAPRRGTSESWKTTGHTNVWAPFSVDDRARACLSPGEHAEQRLVRRRAQGQQSVRRIDRLSRREERASACGTSRPCITVSGTTTFPPRRCSRRCSVERRVARHRRRPDEDGLSVRVRSRDGQADLADRRARGAGERRAGRAGRAVAAVSDASRSRSRSRDSASATSSTSRPRSKRARSRRSRTFASVRCSRRRRSAERS